MAQTYNIQQVGAGVSTGAGSLVVVPPTGMKTDSTDLLCIMAGIRNLASTFTVDPASQGYTLILQGTGNDTRTAIWAKIPTASEPNVNISSAATRFAAISFVLRVTGATWASLGSAVVNSAIGSGTLPPTSTVTRYNAITPVANNTCVLRIANRVTGTSSTITGVNPSTNFTNVDGAGNPLWVFVNGGGFGVLLSAEIWSQGTLAAVPQDDDTVAGLFDSVTSNCSRLSLSLQATGALLPSAATGIDRHTFRGMARGIGRGR